MLKSATKVFLNGKVLGSKFVSSDFGDGETYQDIRINARKCYRKTYNLTKVYGLYNVKGSYMVLYKHSFLMSILPNIKDRKKDRYVARSNTFKLVVN